MPTVPDYRLPQGTLQPLPGPRLDTRVPPNALQIYGETGQRIGSFFDQELERSREENDTVRAEAAINKLHEARNSLIYGPQGALSVTGENVFKGDDPFVPAYQKKFDESAAGLMAELANDNQKNKFARVAGRLRYQVGEELQRHEAQQGKAYRESTFKGIVSTEAENMARAQEIPDAAERADVSAASIERVKQNARVYLSRDVGMSSEQVDAQVLKLESQMHRVVINRLLEADNPMGAKAYYEANRSHISEEDGAPIRKQIEKDGRGVLVGQQADRIWSTLGPKNDADPVNLDVMVREANKTFEKDADARKMLIAEINERRQAHDYSQKERQSSVIGGIWKQVLDRTPLSAIRKSPEFRNLDGASQAEMVTRIEAFQKRNENDPGTQMAKFAQYWAIASDPARLAQTSDAAIFALAPTMGPELTKQLLTQKKTLLNKEDKVIEAKVDQDSFNYYAREAGLDVTPPKDSEKARLLGELKYRLETIIDAEQIKHTPPRQLSRTEKDAIIKKLFTEVPVTVKQPWYFGGGTTTENRRLFEVQYPQNIAIPAAERKTVVDALKRAGVTNPSDAQIREGYIRLKQK